MSNDKVEDKYIKTTQREHVLLKPSMYLGDTPVREEDNYVFYNDQIIKKTIKWSPAFYKIFDEIIVNVYDQTIRDKTLKNIKIFLDRKWIKVSNDGRGIDVAIHKKHGIYVPELIFGNLLSSTNFNQNDDRITGGTHGLGAKLTNIFSTKFEIVVEDIKRNLVYKQTFKNNLSIIEKPVIAKANLRTGGFQVKYYPDFARFDMKELDDDHMALFIKRAYDLAGLTGKNVYVNGKKIEKNNWKEYMNLYDKDLMLYKCNEHWSLGLKLEPNAYQVSFVNGIFTNRGGKHVDYIVDQIYDKYVKKIKDITKRWIKNHFTMVIKTSIVNPSFNSQTKEELMTPYSKMGIRCELDNKFYKLVDIDKLSEMFKATSSTMFTKTDGSKKSKIKGIPKLEDANYAGTKKSVDCTLILTEGDSAKATAISGVSALTNGRNYFGIFPLRGKLLNVRDINIGKINANTEIKNLKKILGLKSSVEYNETNIGQLRYGSIMLMMDADEDGSHIKGLVLNFLHYFYPSLMKVKNFIKVLVTPAVKATLIKSKKDSNVLSFNSSSIFNAWKKINNIDKYKIKYYKGLGTSTSKEAAEYFRDINSHTFYIIDKIGEKKNPYLELAFNKKMADDRKKWLSKYDPEKTLEFVPESTASLKQFINLELKHFSGYSNVRAIPNVIDGFKPSQRKILYGCLKRNLYSEIKVAQLGANVAEVSSYHHGEGSLEGAIIKLAQDFVGSNNINLLDPIGQFGTRLMGGDDKSASRYIFTQLMKVVKLIFKTEDDGLLESKKDDNDKEIEPINYYPIIPMLLVNGAKGMGTGFSTDIPNFNPKDIIQYLLEKLTKGKSVQKMAPYYEGFEGDMLNIDKTTYVSKGVYEIEGNKIVISELPVKVWTSKYKEFIEDLIYNNKSAFGNIQNLSSDKKVKFVIKINDMDAVLKMENDKYKYDKYKGKINCLEKYLKLYDIISLTQLTAFDTNNKLVTYKTPYEMLEEFYKIRLIKYEQRRKLLLKILDGDLKINMNKLRWVKLILDGKIDLRKNNYQDLIKYLTKHKFDTKNNNYDYLLNISIRDMTKDNYNKLVEKIKNIRLKITKLENTNGKKLWIEDLTVLDNYI